MTVSRRVFLNRSAVVVGGVGLASVVAIRRAEAAKMAQTLVGYQTSPKGSQACANCKVFLPPNACQLVDGTISPSGWCKLWQAKTA